MSVIFYIDEEKRWPLVQESVTHVFVYHEQLQQDFHIETVVNGRTVWQLEEEVAGQLEYKAAFYDSIKHGVIIAACHNAVKGQRMEEQGLLNGVATVTNSATEPAAERQTEYLYIEP